MSNNQESVTQYMINWLNYCQESEKQQTENPPKYIMRLREMKPKGEMVGW